MRLGPVVAQAMKEIATETVYPADLVEDTYALLRLAGQVFPTEEQQDKLIAYYSDPKRFGLMGPVLFRRRLASMKMLARKPIFIAAQNMLKSGCYGSATSITKLMLESLRVSELLSLGHCCAGCPHIKNCDTGRVVEKWNIASIQTVVYQLSKLARHEDCPEEASFKSVSGDETSGDTISEDAADIASQAAVQGIDNIKPSDQQSFEDWADIQEATRHIPTMLDDDYSVFWKLTGIEDGDDDVLREIEFGELGKGGGFGRGGGGIIRRLSALSIKPISEWLNTLNLAIFHLARVLERQMLLRKKGDQHAVVKPAEDMKDRRRVAPIESLSQAGKLTSIENARPDDVREHRIVTGQADVKTYEETITKPQLIYVLLDVSASMGSGSFSIPGVPVRLNRRSTTRAFLSSMILRSRSEQGAMYIREYEGYAHPLVTVDPDNMATYSTALARFMTGASGHGGGTDLEIALKTALTDMEESVLKYAPKEIIVLTDGEDAIGPDSRKELKDRMSALGVTLSVLMFLDTTATDDYRENGVYRPFLPVIDELVSTFMRVQSKSLRPEDIIQTVKSL